MARINPEILRKRRKQKRWTLDVLAEKAQLDRQTISRLERGRRGQTRDTTIDKLAKALGAEPEELTTPPDDPESVPEWKPGKSQLNLRISGQARNALLLVSEHYNVRPAQVVELAPLLFNWAAEKCVRQHKERLDQLRRRLSEIEQEMGQFASDLGQLIDGPRPEFGSVFDGVEDVLIEETDPHLFDEWGYGGPIADFLEELASELGDQAEFHGWDSDSSPNYTVCKDEATWLANGDEEALENILQGYAPLQELPKEDWEQLHVRGALLLGGDDEVRAVIESRQRRAVERVEWLRAHGEGNPDEPSGGPS